ncbi:MAG: hypothetical protein M1820_005506 [Bogoriella megaspora]|nr:MAG: hypothetical protein M1820_005506 [Bogoriella megaspora]
MDHDDLDEDLFDDLYEEDNAPSSNPIVPRLDTIKTEAPPVAISEGFANTFEDAIKQENAQVPSYDSNYEATNDVNLSNGYNNNVSVANGSGTDTEQQYSYNEEETPIGIKDDG